MLRKAALRTILAGLAFTLATPALHADIVVDPEFSLPLEIDIFARQGTVHFIPRSGVLILTRVYTGTGFYQALLNSLNAPVSSNAMIPGVHAEAFADPLQRTGSVGGGMNLSNAVSGGAEAISMLHVPFEIEGVTGPVSVSFSATLTGSQSLDTTGGGRNASSDLSFGAKVNGNSVLAFENLLQIGPNTSASYSINQTLTGSLTLDGDTPYNLNERLVYQGLGNVPEPSFFIFLGTGLGGIFLARSIRGRSSTMKE